MTHHPARVKKAEQAVVRAAMRWAKIQDAADARAQVGCGLMSACARLYLARLASKKRKGVKRG